MIAYFKPFYWCFTSFEYEYRRVKEERLTFWLIASLWVIKHSFKKKCTLKCIRNVFGTWTLWQNKLASMQMQNSHTLLSLMTKDNGMNSTFIELLKRLLQMSIHQISLFDQSGNWNSHWKLHIPHTTEISVIRYLIWKYCFRRNSTSCYKLMSTLKAICDQNVLI